MVRSSRTPPAGRRTPGVRHRRGDHDVVVRAGPGRRGQRGRGRGRRACLPVAAAARREGRRRRGRAWTACRCVLTRRRPRAAPRGRCRPRRPPPSRWATPKTSASSDRDQDQPPGPVDPGRERAAGTRHGGHAVTLARRPPRSGMPLRAWPTSHRRLECPDRAHRLPPTCAPGSSTGTTSTRATCPGGEPSAPPWAVLVSEFMLQQTPVARVLPVYERGSHAGPPRPTSPPSPTGEAVRAWGRLGYPRRALRLHAAATRDRRAARRRGAGRLRRPAARCPASATTPRPRWRRFAFGRRHAVLDTNVRRVLARTVDRRRVPRDAR